MDDKKWIQVRKSAMTKYKLTALYYKTDANEYQLYKPEGKMLDQVRINTELHPKLYIKAEDKEKAIIEMQKVYNQELKSNIATGNIKEVKATLVNVVEETLSEPRAGTLHGVRDTVDIMIGGYSQEPKVLNSLAAISYSDYTTGLHSVNVMALTIAFAEYCGYESDLIKNLGLSALLHDLGKTTIPNEILNAKRKLTDDEFAVIRNHPLAGYNILKRSGFNNSIVLSGAIQHHEKLDGSGYPNRITKLDLAGKIISIIDCYEAITNDDRPYRSAMDPLKALYLLKKDVDLGKFDKDIFSKFAYSLV